MKTFVYLAVLLIFAIFYMVINTVVTPISKEEVRQRKNKEKIENKYKNKIWGVKGIEAKNQLRNELQDKLQNGGALDSNLGSKAKTWQKIEQDLETVDIAEKILNENEVENKIIPKNAEEIIYTGGEYGVYYLDSGNLKFYGNYWFDFVKTPSQILRKSEHQDVYNKRGCCLWERENKYEVVIGSPLFKKMGYKIFKKKNN